MKHLAVFAAFVALVLSLPPVAQAQALPPAPTPNLPANVYEFGLSYNNGASPSIAGTFGYSHLLTPTDGVCVPSAALCGTYGYTVMDILPLSFNPSVVATSIGVGVAQKVLTINGINFFIPASVGPTITGTNMGWAWTTGGLADVPIKKAGVPTHWHLHPNIRLVNATVNGTSGHQLVFGGNIAYVQ